jgi:small-conductance mechanosensitive channel
MNIDTELIQIQTILSEKGLLAWLIMATFSFVLTVVIKFILSVVMGRLRKLADRTGLIWDNVAVDIVDGLKFIVLFICIFYISSKSLQTSPTLQKTMLIAVVACAAFQSWYWGRYLIKKWYETVLMQHFEKDASTSAALGLLYTIFQAIFVITVLLIGLSNVGVDIGALIAGLGIGGIAVALAAQNFLGDLLASLSIVLDKPFIVGDFIVTKDDAGTVEHIGIKTTRVRSLSGELLVLSNKNLLESRIRNYKQMSERRVIFSIGVVYSTPRAIVEKIPGWIKEIVEKQNQVRFDRCNFSKFANSALEFEIVFYILDPDYNIYMDQQEKILVGILEKFTAEGVEFAFPTKTIHVESLPEVGGH